MSLITCVGCNNQLSPELKSCPSCGANCGASAAKDTVIKGIESQPMMLTVLLSACAIVSSVAALLVPFFLGTLVFTALAGILGFLALSKSYRHRYPHHRYDRHDRHTAHVV